MNLNPVVLSIPIYFVLIGIELLVNQFEHKKRYRLNDAVTNISCGITQQLTGIFLKVFGVGIYMLVYENFALFDIPSNVYTIIILFVAADFCYYWAHRMSHQINLFWGGHVVHHQSEDYNLSVALRQSTFQTVWTFSFHLPLALLGFNTTDHIMVMGLNLIYQFWIHTETIGKLGWFESIFNTPSHHRVHHGRNPKYIDKNHAGVFIIWDKLFGTFQEEEERPTYGITKPVKSWNPVWVNLEHYVDMWHQLKTIPTAKNKLKYVFYKPGWLPKEMGGYQTAPEVDEITYKKFVTKTPMNLNLYVLLHYAMALTGTAFFLFNQHQFSMFEKGGIAMTIIFTITTGGMLFENKPWVKYLEMARIVMFTIGGVYLAYMEAWHWPILLGAVLFALISLPWLFALQFKRSSLQVI